MEKLYSLIHQMLIRFFYCKFFIKEMWAQKNKWRIGFLSEEFEHRDLMPFGGYGMTLKFVTDYFNTHAGPIKGDVLMCEKKDIPDVEVKKYHSAELLFLPKKAGRRAYLKCQNILSQKHTNLFVGVDHYKSYEYYLENFPYIPWVVWIKDPKDRGVWERLATIPMETQSWGVTNSDDLIKQGEYHAASLRQMIRLGKKYGRKIYFAVEASHLTEIARHQYSIQDMNPFHWPKPIPLPAINKPSFSLKPSFLFLARLDPIKRPWIYCEIAKRFKDADFYVAGKTHQPDRMDPVLSKYKDIPNLKFMGRIDGEKKAALLNTVWAVVNTSIHEGVPVSLLEGFSFGKPAIAALNPEETTNKFGIYVGDILGNGDDAQSIEKFSEAVAKVINGTIKKEEVGMNAREYIAKFHSFPYFESSLLNALKNNSPFEYHGAINN